MEAISGTPREFWLKVQGGLCNRMRALASAIGFAEQTGRRLRVCWPSNRRFQFTSPRNIRMFPWIRRFPAEYRFEAMPNDLWQNSFDLVSEDEWRSRLQQQTEALSEFPPKPESTAQLLMLDTCHDFFRVCRQTPFDLYTKLHLNSQLSQRLRQLDSSLPAGKRVGVHLRRVNAHDKTLSEVSIDWFIRKTKQLLDIWPDATVYVVTDDTSFAEPLCSQLGERLRMQKPVNGYNTLRAIQKALIDVHMLASTDFILGSYFSSMSYLSADMQGRRGYEDVHVHFGEPIEALKRRHG